MKLRSYLLFLAKRAAADQRQVFVPDEKYGNENFFFIISNTFFYIIALFVRISAPHSATT